MPRRRCSVNCQAIWDLQAAAQAGPVVESWLPNYHGIGLVHLTAEQLRQRLDCWSTALLAGRNL